MSKVQDFVTKARDGGYSDKEIFDFIAKKPEYAKKAKASKEAGYSPEEIVDFLSSQKPERKPGDYGAKIDTEKQKQARELMQQHPGVAAAAPGLGLTDFIEGAINFLSHPEKLATSLVTGKAQPKNIAGNIREKLHEGLPQDQKERAKELEHLSAVIPIPGAGAALPARASMRAATNVPKGLDAIGRMHAERAAIPPVNMFGNAGKGQEALAQGVIGENLPTSMFETAEKALAESAAKIGKTDSFGVKIGPQSKQGTGSLKERATQSEEVIEGKRPGFGIEVPIARKEGGKSLQGTVKKPEGPGHAISPMEFENDAVGGRIQSREVRQNAANARREVTNLYNQAEENYQNINSIGDTHLLDELGAEAARLEQSVRPNTAESSVINAIRGIMQEYERGNGLRVSRLIKGSDSISGMANYELPFTGPKEILKKVASILDRAAMRAIDNNGGNSALLKEANQAYGRWANRYANDEISPFLERTINNPESLFRKSVNDEGSFRAIEEALQDSPRGQEYINVVARKIAEKKMGKFKPSQIGSSEYQAELRNLRGLIGDRRANAYDQAVRRELRTPGPRPHPKEGTKGSLTGRVSGPQKVEKPSRIISESPNIRISPQRIESRGNDKLTKLIEKISEQKKTKPEDIISKLKTRSGIKELKKELSPHSFNTLVKQKARSILQEGNIEHKFSGDQMFKILNKEENFEIFSEILGKEEALALKESAKELGRKAVTVEAIKTIAKTAAKSIVGIKALKIFIGLI